MPNERHRITVERTPLGHLRSNSMETDALNGVGSIPGVTDLQVEETGADFVTLSCRWTGTTQFDRTDDHLLQYGLQRRWNAK
jgi:hypothetical protein